jgi:hypothetical protein
MKYISEAKTKTLLWPSDGTREIWYYHLRDVEFSLTSNAYPNVVVREGTIGVCTPIQEKVMSLSAMEDSPDTHNEYKTFKRDDSPKFFFVYNLDNYFHFLYDTLPYLITFQKLKEQIPNLRLLVQHPPGLGREAVCPFVYEFLEILGISRESLDWVDTAVCYGNVYVSDSYTHAGQSDAPPRKEVYELYNQMKASVFDGRERPKKIYISRRTWKHGNTSNIGTDYTARRRMVNEDEVVRRLESAGYTEIFSECLTTREKINLFAGATHIVGAIGGGVANAVFAKDARLHVLISPTFMDRHQRFKYVFSTCRTSYVDKSSHVDSGHWKRYMRVQIKGTKIVGEVEEILPDGLLVSYVNEVVAGWNSKMLTAKEVFPFSDCYKLDDGLNSPWKLELAAFDDLVKED